MKPLIVKSVSMSGVKSIQMVSSRFGLCWKGGITVYTIICLSSTYIDTSTNLQADSI